MLKLGRDPLYFAVFMACVNLIFYSTNWTEYFTHVLRTNQNNIGVTEIHMVYISINLICFFFGDEVFQGTIFGWNTILIFTIFVCLNMLVNIPPLLIEAWQKTKSKVVLLSMAVPITWYVSLIIFVYFHIPSLFVGPTLQVAIVFNVTFNILAVKIITASLTRMTYSWLQIENVMLTIVLVLTYYTQSADRSFYFPLFVNVYALVVVGRLLHLALSIIFDISGYLKINVLFVPKIKN